MEIIFWNFIIEFIQNLDKISQNKDKYLSSFIINKFFTEKTNIFY